MTRKRAKKKKTHRESGFPAQRSDSLVESFEDGLGKKLLGIGLALLLLYHRLGGLSPEDDGDGLLRSDFPVHLFFPLPFFFLLETT